MAESVMSRDPPKLGAEPRCSQRLGVSVSCKSKTNFRAFRDNWIVIWLKQSNFISNAGSLLRPDQEEFETIGIYYLYQYKEKKILPMHATLLIKQVL
jgi:hypothetical protein